MVVSGCRLVMAGRGSSSVLAVEDERSKDLLEVFAMFVSVCLSMSSRVVDRRAGWEEGSLM